MQTDWYEPTQDLTFDARHFPRSRMIGLFGGIEIYVDPIALEEWTGRFPSSSLDELLPRHLERAATTIARDYDSDPHAYLVRCPDLACKLALEVRPERTDLKRLIGDLHAVLSLDEYADPSQERGYREGLSSELRRLIEVTSECGGYAVVDEVADSPFYKHLIERGEHRTSHRIIQVGDDAINRHA